jgi:pimeloyl-ACP methyl ester carboxylesterase
MTSSHKPIPSKPIPSKPVSSKPVLFLHGSGGKPGGHKPTYIQKEGFTVLNPQLPEESFESSCQVGREHCQQDPVPGVIVGSSRGGAVAMSIMFEFPLVPVVLIAPAWRHFNVEPKIHELTVILHCPQDTVVPFLDTQELLQKSGLSLRHLIAVGRDHRLNDEASLQTLMRQIKNALT